MYFKNKLVLIFLFSFLFFPIFCTAKSIEIDRISYNTDTVLEKENFIYNPIKDTLILKNATLKNIKTKENIKIILEGDNYILNEDKVLSALTAKKIQIEGSGTLTIESAKTGIVAEKITINGVSIKINSLKQSIISSSSSDYDFIVNNTNLELSSNNDAIDCIGGNVYFNNSNILVNKANQFITDFTNNVYINNSNLNISEVQTMRFGQVLIYINDMSFVKVKATNNMFLNSSYNVSNNMNFLTSKDDITYSEVDKSSRDIYIKIYNKISQESLIEKEKELQKEKELLISKENDIEEKLKQIAELERKLEEQEKELNLKMSNLNFQLGNLNNLKNELIEKEEKLTEFETNLLINEENLNLLKKEIDREKEIIEIQKEKVNEDLVILNEFEKNLKIKESEILKKEEELNGLETTLDCDSKNYDYIENPKTYDGFATAIISFIISFIGIIALFITKRGGVNE